MFCAETVDDYITPVKRHRKEAPRLGKRMDVKAQEWDFTRALAWLSDHTEEEAQDHTGDLSEILDMVGL